MFSTVCRYRRQSCAVIRDVIRNTRRNRSPWFIFNSNNLSNVAFLLKIFKSFLFSSLRKLTYLSPHCLPKPSVCFLKNYTLDVSSFAGKLPSRRKFELLWAFPSVYTYPYVGITGLKRRHPLLGSKPGNAMFSLPVCWCLTIEARGKLERFRILWNWWHFFLSKRAFLFLQSTK